MHESKELSSPWYPGLQYLHAEILPLPEVNVVKLLGHSVHTALAEPEYLPISHDSHAPDPDPAFFLPPGHTEHALSSPDVNPGRQEQADALVLPCGEEEFKGQIVQ